MKNITTFVLFLLTFTAIFAGHAESVRFSAVSSEEADLNGVFVINFKVIALDTIRLQNSLDQVLPVGCKATNIAFVDTLLIPGDSVLFSTTVTFEFDTLPYFPQLAKFHIEVFCRGEIQSVGEFVHFYFTPYNTLEIWSDYDFVHLKRDWFAPVGRSVLRKYINPDSIPISNIPDDFDPIEQWERRLQSIHLEGLAYGIPMLATHPDLLQMDTTDHFPEDTVGRYDGCSNPLARRYQGIIKGNVTSIFRELASGANSYAIHPLEGLDVEIWEYDNGLWSDVLETAVTDVNGDFEVSVNTCQMGEGGELEIFARVIASNYEYEIVGKNTRLFGVPQDVDSDQVPWVYNSGNVISDLNIGSFMALNGAHRAVHFAQEAYRFVNSNSGITLDNGLTIRAQINVNSGQFLPTSYCGAPLPIGWIQEISIDIGINQPIVLQMSLSPTPVILLTDDAWENTNFHEFGHFVMWQLQGKCFTEPLSLAGSHPFSELRNPRMAWSEGWADGFSVIVDAVYGQVDGEFGKYGALSFENQSSFPPLLRDEGFRSEYKIGCSIYDLWDGSDKFSTWGSSPTASEYDDSQRSQSNPYWNSPEIDQVSLAFSEICQPLRDGDQYAPHNQIETIQGFYKNLIANRDCESRAQIQELFDQNRIVGISEFFPSGSNLGLDYKGFSSDDIAAMQLYEYDDNRNIPRWHIDFIHEYDQNVLWTSGQDYNLGTMVQNGDRFLSDDLLVKDGASLFFNKNIPLGWVAVNSADRPATNSTMPADLCGGMTLEAVQNGNIVVGDQAVSAYADVHLKPGGTIILGGAGVSNTGKLLINNHSRLYIESGSTLIIDEGAQIELAGSDAVLEIDGNLIIRNNATFTFTGAGHVRWGNAVLGSNVTCGTNSGFVLQGSGNTDPILYLKANSHIQPQTTLKNFQLKNGAIRMAQGASISTADAAYVLDNIDVALDGNSGRHNGIYVHGQANHLIRNVEISGATRGITAYQMWNQGATLKLDHCEFHDNETGLQVHTRGVRMTFCDFHDNTIGYNQEAGSVLSFIQLSDFNNNVRGIEFNSNPGDLYFRTSNANNNEYGIRFQGLGSLYSKCSNTSNNTEAGIVVAFGAKLRMGDAFDASGSHHNSVNNKYGVASLFSTEMDFDFGSNNLVQTQQNANRDVYGYMAIPNATTVALDANRNHWKSGNTAPVYNSDYLLVNINGSAYQVNLVDNNPVAAPLCAYGPSGQGGSALRTCSDCPTIATEHYENVKLDAAVRDAIGFLEIVDSTGDDSVAVQRFTEIYSTFADVPATDEEAYLQRLVWDLAKTAFGGACASGKISTLGSVNMLSNDPSIVAMQNMLADAPGIGGLTEFLESFDQTLFDHTKGFMDTTLIQLDSLMQVTVPGFQSFVDYTDCYVEAENQLLDGTMTFEAFETAIQNCGSNKWEEADLLTDGSLERFAASLHNTLSMVAYPSPIGNTVWVQLKSPSGTQPKLTVWDMQGRMMVLKQTEEQTAAPLFRMQLDTEHLAAGLYILRAEADGQVLTQKLVKE